MGRSPEIIAEEYKLISAYKDSGDLEILGKLYKPYMHLVYGVALKYLKDREQSQDVVMQIFEKLIDTLKSHQVENFKSWLYVMTKNHCLMYIRSKQNQMNKQQKDIDTFDMESKFILHHNDETLDEEKIHVLERCIDELQNEQKVCIQLFYLEKRSYREIEQLTKHDLKKVKSYIQNGKRNLKICMEKNIE